MEIFYPAAVHPTLPNLAAYTANFVWAASSARTFMVIASGVGSATTTAPTLQAQVPVFEVPESVACFGIEVNVNKVSGIPPVTWTTAKLECWVGTVAVDVVIPNVTAGPSLQLDSGQQQPPLIYCDAAVGVNRNFVDVVGGDSAIPNTVFIASNAITGTARRSVTYWFSPFNLGGYPRIGHYKTIYALFSLDPADAALTGTFTVSMRPVALREVGRVARGTS